MGPNPEGVTVSEGRVKPQNRDDSLVAAATRAAALPVLRRIAESYASGSLPEWELLANTVTVSAFAPRERIDLTGRVAVVLRGHVKLTSVDATGAEMVLQFMGKGDVFAPSIRPAWAERTGPPMSLSRWVGAPWSVPPMEVTTLTRVTLLHLDFRVAEELAARHAAWGQVVAAFLWTYIDGLFSGILDERQKDVATRYRALVARRGLAGVAKQREIASYLNVTEEALSRIVKRINLGTPIRKM